MLVSTDTPQKEVRPIRVRVSQHGRSTESVGLSWEEEISRSDNGQLNSIDEHAGAYMGKYSLSGIR